ncbi:MAG TPA: hypothetical protein VGM70_12660 [Pseudolysinimonas sp.]|jgi:hypothetical protein
MIRRVALTLIALVALVGASLSVIVADAPPAQAATASQFDPGLIISDAKFYNGSALSASDIQSFLNSHGPACQSGYTCLKNYHQVTFSRAGETGNCADYVSSGDETAATIIAKVGQACGISQAALIVLLQKEQGLITSSAPSSTAYRSATGYGCPDTAACDSTYYGFFNQVWMAALQFKRYAANPTHWTHIAGRVNSIQFSPNASCGASDVLIQNAATAGLYDYTPYQPNAAALANLYGTGDGCSSYGNRNFWSYYTDWFGPTNTASLVRTATSAQIYIVTDTTKFPINDLNTYSAYAALGGFGYVSQSYLDTLTTGPVAGRIIRGPDGAIYFIDAAIKVLFTTCQQVLDYGGSCDNSGYVQLTATQIAAFHTGPAITPVLGTVEGSRYLLTAGVKHEILDDQSQAGAGLPAGFNVLTEAALANMPYGAPIIRDGVFVSERGTSNYDYVSGSRRRTISSAEAAGDGALSRTAGLIRPQSMALVPSDGVFSGVVALTGSSDVQVLTTSGRVHLTDPTAAAAVQPLAVAQPLLDAYPDLGSVGTGAFVKSSTDATVYQLSSTGLRSVPSWDVLVALAKPTSPSISVLPPSLISGLPKGAPVLAPGALYRAPDNPSIYLIDGASKIYVGSFDITGALGINGYSMTTASALTAYSATSLPVGYGVVCGSQQYVAAGSGLHAVTSVTTGLFPFAWLTLDPSTCRLLTVGSDALPFIRTPDGSIYQLESGKKFHLSFATWVKADPSGGWMSVSAGFAGAIPSGPDR